MRKGFQHLPILLFSGLVALSGLTQAGKTSQPKVQFYALNIHNSGVHFIKQGVGSPFRSYNKTTLTTPALFGDPPNISFNDSPVIFLALFLSDREAEELKNDDQANISKYGSELRRELYIGAAGYEAAKQQKLSDMIPTSRTDSTLITRSTALKNSINGSHLDQHFKCKPANNTTAKDGIEPKKPCIDNFNAVTELENFDCFNESDKAEFHACAARWALKFRTGIVFDKSMVVIEQDNEAMSVMANNVIRDKQLQPDRHFILQATSLAQPYLNDVSGLVFTPAWMGILGKKGGNYQIGEEFSDQLKTDHPSGSLQKAMSASGKPLYRTVERYFNQTMESGGENSVFIAGNQVLNEEQLLQRIINFRAKNNMGTLLFRIADPTEHSGIQELTGISDQDMVSSLKQANVFINNSRNQGAFSLALFMGLLEPSFDKGGNLIVVGENAEWFAGSHGKSFTDVLNDIAFNDSTLTELHKIYTDLSSSTLSSSVFKAFDKINYPHTRSPDHLHPGKDKAYFKKWLLGLAGKYVNKIHFIPKKEYTAVLFNASRMRFRQVTN